MDNTALNGETDIRENINIYSTVQENSSRSTYPTELNSNTQPISRMLRITRNMGATVTAVLYVNPTRFATILFFSNMLLSFTPIPAITYTFFPLKPHVSCKITVYAAICVYHKSVLVLV